MVLSTAVQWWEEWQLRILVLGSLGVQCYLAMFVGARKKHNRPFFRFSIWLTYLGGDALAIYALAVLFNRQRKLRYNSVNGNHDLEVLWAPVLLIHLGGNVNICAYNIEDNELWTRHVLTTVSQVTVAIYVFFMSWSSSADKRLLAAAILLFIIGLFKCFDKPSALKRASFNSIVTTFRPAKIKKSEKREVELEEYIQEAQCFVQPNLENPVSSHTEFLYKKQLTMPDKLFVDHAYVYDDRLTTLKFFWLLDEENTYNALCVGRSDTFDLMYSKGIVGLQALGLINKNKDRTMPTCAIIGILFSALILLLNLLLPIVPIVLFHGSQKNAYRATDIKWSDGVAQRSLLGFLAWNRRHTRIMSIAEFFQCKGLLDTYFGFWHCHSSKSITMLVHEHVKAGWMSYIADIESYWSFSDRRGQWALERNGGEEILLRSIDKPFDESIILWHVATDFCFHEKGTSHDFQCARMCRQISNYMMHLLFANPEILLPGSRRNLFTVAYDELKAILQGDDDPLPLDERGLTLKIFSKAKSVEGYIQDSWVLAQELMKFGDDNKMWEIIKGVWIEMLCFSAGRCRGYLHAKSLGSGGEYLSYVALLMLHAGLETYAERQQRVQLRLPKVERVKIAKQRIQEAANKQATGGSSTPQAMVHVKEEIASTSASRVEYVGPAPEIKFSVSTITAM